MNYKSFLTLVLAIVLHACSGTKGLSSKQKKTTSIDVTIDLIEVLDDRVKVTVQPHFQTTAKTLVYAIPKIVPGTYSIDNYGAYIHDFKAYTVADELLKTTKNSENSWEIETTKPLKKITYFVADTFDIESEHNIFSPSGTNILKDQNFVLNLHGFIGYFKEYTETPYTLTIQHPAHLKATTSLKPVIKTTTALATETVDRYSASRYSEITDGPILYAKPDIASFQINDIEVTLSVYSPNKIHTAASIKPAMEKMMRAQKNFLGEINATKNYSILLYLSEMSTTDAKGFGALEHNTSTVVVLPEIMPLKQLRQTMVDVVSHEFFHIVTPLSIHSKEIHYFDYNAPKMSQHLWMYEGTTEYFAQLFQIQQQLISTTEFYNRIIDKVNRAKRFDDRMSFTTMSKNILLAPYKDNYINVYEKGALISMCIDLIIREKSNGKRGILDLMKALSNWYGRHEPFEDDKLIDQITALTYPEVGDFMKQHVMGTTPIAYQEYWNKVGLEFGTATTKAPLFTTAQQHPYITGSEDKKQIVFVPKESYNCFLDGLGVQGGDVLKKINNKKYALDTAFDLFEDSKKWTEGEAITMDIERKGFGRMTLTGKVSIPKITKPMLVDIANPTVSQLQLRKAWIGN